MMMCRRALIAIIAVSLLIGGCASQSGGELKDSWWKCATAGGILGGAGGALDDDKSLGYGALAGAVLGGVICAVTGDKGASVESSPQPECEFVIAGWDVAMYGCPVDTDQDGVPDPLDQCPGTVPGTPVDEMGCAVVVTTIEQEIYLDPVHFALSSAELSTTSATILNQELAVIQDYPDSRVVITGYTDSTGPKSYNEELSRNRARSVQDYLITNGVNPARIELYADGPEDPIESNDTRSGREMNRRVQIILKPQ